MGANQRRARRHRPRVQPRSGGRRGSRIQWDRLGRIVLLVVLAAVVAMYARPMLSVADSLEDAKAEDRRLDDVQREHRRLEKRFEGLTDGKKSKERRDSAADAAAGESAAPDADVLPSADGAGESGDEDAASAEGEPDAAPVDAGEPAAPDEAEAPPPPASDPGTTAPGDSGGVTPGV
ncbi:MAG: hypothetical protein ACR2N5_00025 [Solirubrobacterales bacterium]